VSATRAKGQTVRVRVESTVGGELRLRDPFGSGPVRWNRTGIRRIGYDYVVRLPKGAMLEGTRAP
jgi:hypothetical protein